MRRIVLLILSFKNGKTEKASSKDTPLPLSFNKQIFAKHGGFFERLLKASYSMSVSYIKSAI